MANRQIDVNDENYEAPVLVQNYIDKFKKAQQSDHTMNYPYVYRLTHKETKEFYIGYRKANQVASHLDLGHKYTTSSKLIKDMGFANFDIEVLCECINPDRKIAGDDAYDIENEIIAEVFYNSLCLNGHFRRGGKARFRITEEGTSKMKATNANRSDEEKARIKDKRTLAWRNKSNEEKIAIAEKQKETWANKGATVSEDTRIKISIAKTGVRKTDQARLNMSIAQKIAAKDETNAANRSATQKITQNRPEVAEKKRLANLGKVASTEARVNMSNSSAKARSYIVTSPYGDIYEGIGLNKLCNIHELCHVGMAMVCRGKQKAYKGWTGEYTDGK